MRPKLSTRRGVTIPSLVLADDRDLDSLIRRTRAAAAELGFTRRQTRDLCTAVLEAGRLLVRASGGRARITAAGGPALQVLLSCSRNTAVRDLLAQLTLAVEPLRPLVNAIDVEHRARTIHVRIRAERPRGAGSHLSLPPLASPLDDDAIESLTAEELQKRYRELQLTVRSLQSELHDTNLGVVALHAELEAQADMLRAAEDRLRLLLDSVQDYAICMLTRTGVVDSWNAGAERLFGYAAEEIIGRHVSRFYSTADGQHDLAAAHLRHAREHGRAAAECVLVRRDGVTFDAHLVLTAVGRGGDLRGLAFVVRDITERRRLEVDLRRRAEELAAANRAKEDFLATLSHELRTPLNAMLGWTRLLRLGKLDQAGTTRALDTIERNARIQEQLIADILDVSRIVTGKLRLEFRSLDLVPVIDAALDAVRPAADAKRVRLAFEAGTSATVLGDPDRLQQVVWNLLVNALKFTPPDGSVSVALSVRGGTAAISVADSGEGIPADLLPVIFDRFTQGDPSVTRPHGGLGLGLSIVRHIVELHGGSVRAHSEGPGHGATFTVHLPIRAARQAERGPTPQPLVGVKVLIADDDPGARETLS